MNKIEKLLEGLDIKSQEWVDEVTTKPNSYKAGDWAKIEVGEFSMKRAVERYGFRESLDHFIEQQGRNPFQDGHTSGVANYLEGKVFAIAEDAADWPAVVAHEFGHLVLQHQPSAEELLFLIPNKIERELREKEARLFSILLLKKLGMYDSVPEVQAMLLKHITELFRDELGMEPMPDWVYDHIEQKVNEFYEAGLEKA